MAKVRGVESNLHRMSLEVNRTSAWKGRVAEAAVLLRLVAMGFEPMRSVFEGDHSDWTIRIGDRVVRIQVRWAYQPRRHGQPVIDLRRWNGRVNSRYADGDVEFVIGYDLYTDTAYVFSWSEIREKGAVSVRPDAAERWDKISQGVAQPG